MLLGRVEAVVDLRSIGFELEVPSGELGGQGGHRLGEVQRHLLLAELLHELVLALDQDQLALVDHAHAIGHLLGLLDVVRGQDDGHALVAELAHQRPHVAAELDVDAGRRLVEEQDVRLVRQRLGDHHAPLHAARERLDAVVALLPERQRLEHALDVARVRGAPEQSAAEAAGGPGRLEHLRDQLLRHEPDAGTGVAVVLHDVVAGGGHRARARRHDSAHDVDQRGLAGAVRAEQGEDLALLDVEVHRFERLQAGGVGLRKVFDREDGRHRGTLTSGRSGQNPEIFFCRAVDSGDRRSTHG